MQAVCLGTEARGGGGEECRFRSELFLDVVVIAVGAVARDHLADEACEKEHHADQDGDQGQIKERLVRDRAETHALGLVDEFGDDDGDGHDPAGEEHKDACETEEVHGLPAKSAEKP